MLLATKSGGVAVPDIPTQAALRGAIRRSCFDAAFLNMPSLDWRETPDPVAPRDRQGSAMGERVIAWTSGVFDVSIWGLTGESRVVSHDLTSGTVMAAPRDVLDPAIPRAVPVEHRIDPTTG